MSGVARFNLALDAEPLVPLSKEIVESLFWLCVISKIFAGVMPIPIAPVELITLDPGNVVVPVRLTAFIVAPDVKAAQAKSAFTCVASAVVPLLNV